MCGCSNISIPTTKQILHGAVSIIKSQMNIEVAPLEIMKQRAQICISCEFKTHIMVLGIKMCQCSKCNCIINEKVKRQKESCPIQKWADCNTHPLL